MKKGPPWQRHKRLQCATGRQEYARLCTDAWLHLVHHRVPRATQTRTRSPLPFFHILRNVYKQPVAGDTHACVLCQAALGPTDVTWLCYSHFAIASSPVCHACSVAA